MLRSASMTAATVLLPWLIAACAATPAREASASKGFDVTITRDAFGVAHVFGKTDAAAAYGFGYAQAEDGYDRIEENFLRATGRAAEFFGEEALLDDWLNASLGVVELAQKEYRESPRALRALLDGYRDGLERYAVQHVSEGARRLERFESWHPLALIRYLYFQRGFVRFSGATEESIKNAFTFLNGAAPRATVVPRAAGRGSNSWAVTGRRSRSGRALLFINPHLPYFGAS